MACFAFLWVPAYAGMTGVCAGMTECGPLCPSDISPAERGKPCPMATPITLTLALSHQGRGDASSRPLWIPACGGPPPSPLLKEGEIYGLDAF